MGASFYSHFPKLLVTLISLTFFLNLSSAARPISPHPSTEFIKTSCSSTTYPKLCISSLSTHANLIQTSPKLIAHTALNVTLATAKATSVMMVNLSKSQGMKPKEVEAMQDCLEELSDTVDELRKSIGEMGQINNKGSDFGMLMSDIQTWVSAALTDESTCSDGFGGKAMNGKVKTTLRLKIMNIAHLTSNALALINRYASIHG
ncbi:hypothetical protein SLEP1_g42232 [Rubroshorea leprosula]|uniref:Pectinesterase inhibitor domain-containing protein n=1 Tax=Rubroshorea leprosula TaxID=152421 RepID=A0AAV5L9T5_9ROSI|nr:hypothetical protein SLEP1_g42232 [Rubroshorea leprosula]